MTGPLWLAAAFAAIIAATAVYCLLRLVVSVHLHRPTDGLLDGVHVLMGVAMAGMLLPPLRVAPTGAWEIVFAGATAVFGWRMLASRTTGSAHQFQHVLGCAAMLYMLVATPKQHAVGATSAMGTMTGATRLPTVALILACGLLGYVVWTADQIPSLSRVAVSKVAVSRVAVSRVAVSRVAVSRVAVRPACSPVPVLTSADPESAAPASSLATAPRPTLRSGTPLSPRLAAGCEIAMGLTMGYMLITMLS